MKIAAIVLALAALAGCAHRPPPTLEESAARAAGAANFMAIQQMRRSLWGTWK